MFQYQCVALSFEVISHDEISHLKTHKWSNGYQTLEAYSRWNLTSEM